MRPRLFTAENGEYGRAGSVASLASMRPRLFTAENDSARRARGIVKHASMRPRLFTAENIEYGQLEVGVMTLQ